MSNPAVHPAPGGLSLAMVGGLLGGAAVGHGDQPRGERELHDVLVALTAEGATLPADAALCLERLAQLDAIHRGGIGDPAAVVARADLEHLSGFDLARVVEFAALDRAQRLDDAGTRSAIRHALLVRAVSGLAAAVPDLLDPLAQSFRSALADVQDAVDAGITTTTTADEAIDLGDDAVAAWRRLIAPTSGVGRLNRLWALRCRLLQVVGCHVPPAPTPVAGPDPLGEALARTMGSSYERHPDTAPAGVPDGWGRTGRTAWLHAASAGHDLVAEYARPALIAARVNERTGRSTVPVDAPDRWQLERAEFASPGLDMPDAPDLSYSRIDVDALLAN